MSDACACGTPYKPAAAFCARCGVARVGLGSSLQLTFVVYFSLLAIAIAVAVYAKLTDDSFGAVLVGTCGMTLVALVAAVVMRSLVRPSLGHFGSGWRGLALVLVLAPAITLGIVLYAEALQAWFGLHVEDELAFLDGRSLAWAVLILVVLAPVGEELAFRGLVFPALARSLGLVEAYAVTAFAFGILHLAIPSLLTHVPLGLYLCWLRHRSGSLWPPTLAHALHNAGVMLYEILR